MAGLGDGPIEMSLLDLMNSLAAGVDAILNGKDVLENPELRKNGFVLLVFPFNDDSGRCNYISNGASRTDIVKMFKEQIKRFEEQMSKETS